MLSVTFTKTESQTFLFSDEQAKEITSNYITEVIIGKNCEVLDNGRIEQWDDGHGSGLYTDLGEATPLQLKAIEFLRELWKKGKS